MRASESIDVGQFQYHIPFAPALTITVRDRQLLLQSVTVHGEKIVQKKMGLIPIAFEGFYDWQTLRGTIAPMSPVKLSFTPDLEHWMNFDGEFPELTKYQMIINRYKTLIEPNQPVPDLSTLCNFL